MISFEKGVSQVRRSGCWKSPLLSSPRTCPMSDVYDDTNPLIAFDFASSYHKDPYHPIALQCARSPLASYSPSSTMCLEIDLRGTLIPGGSQPPGHRLADDSTRRQLGGWLTTVKKAERVDVVCPVACLYQEILQDCYP